MSQLTRNFDFLAMVLLVLLLGVAQVPGERSERLMRTSRILHVTEQRIVPRIQERMASCTRMPQIKRLVYSMQGK